MRLGYVLTSIFLLLWVTSFVESGVLQSKAEATEVFGELVSYDYLGTFLALPILFYLIEIVPLSIFIPLAFGLRAPLLFAMMFIENPASMAVRVMWFCIGIVTLMEFLAICQLYLLTIPKDVRGTMLGCFAFFGEIGSLIFTYSGGKLHDVVGPVSPFVVVAISDLAFFLLSVTLGCLGYFAIKKNKLL